MTEHPESDISPVWSPDGKQLLFVSRRRGDADLFVQELDTGELEQLTRSERDEYDPAWSPDGQWIAFATQIGIQSDIYVMRADGTEPVNLTNSPEVKDYQPAWTADSEWLVFASYSEAKGVHDLIKMRRDGSEMASAIDDDYDSIAPSLRPAQ